jgi:hypothetical protein
MRMSFSRLVGDFSFSSRNWDRLMADRLVSSLDLGWHWCSLYSPVDEENVEVGEEFVGWLQLLG